MLYLVGVGLKPEHLTLEALKVLKACDRLYLESYTSQFAEGKVKELEKLVGKKIFLLNRQQVEEETEKFLSLALKNDIALMVYGNVFSATTHIELELEAKRQGIKTGMLPGISIFNFLGKTGLQEYKFGKTVSIVYWQPNYQPESFYENIKENFERGLHTLCLLDIKAEKRQLMSVKEGIELLEKIGAKKKDSFLKETTLVGLAGAGSEKEQIFAKNLAAVKKHAFKAFPQSLIVCGKLNEKEEEALKPFKRSKG